MTSLSTKEGRGHWPECILFMCHSLHTSGRFSTLQMFGSGNEARVKYYFESREGWEEEGRGRARRFWGSSLCGVSSRHALILSVDLFVFNTSPNTRVFHSSQLVPFARTAAYFNSFFISTTRLWNSLPANYVHHDSVRQFKRCIQNTFLCI